MQRMQKFDTVILGAGLAGLYAAYKSAKNGEKSCIIDKAPEPGGLMRSASFIDPNGQSHSFDYGIHYLLLTGTQDIDAEITEFIQKDDWHWLSGSLPEGHVYKKTLDEDTGCLDIQHLPEYHEILSEFFKAPKTWQKHAHLYDAILHDFGQTAHDKIFAPICKKFTGHETYEVAQEAHGVFGPYRLKLLNDVGTVKKLKEIPEFDRLLAYPATDVSPSQMIKAYPKMNKGIGVWVDDFVNALKDLGVEFFLDTELDSFSKSGQAITQLSLRSDGAETTLSCDKIISGLAPAQLGRMFNIAMPGSPPKRRHMILLHYVFETALIPTKNHWITIYDPDFEAFRLTLYDNITQKRDSKFHRLTVEILRDSYHNEEIEQLKARILDELKLLNIIDKTASPYVCFHDICPSAVPVLMPGWQDTLKQQSNILTSNIDNLIPVGLAAGVHFGQVANLRSVHHAFTSWQPSLQTKI